MRRIIPLCAVFCATCLLLVGVGMSLDVETPPPPTTDSATAEGSSGKAGVLLDSKWTETVKKPGKKKKSP